MHTAHWRVINAALYFLINSSRVFPPHKSFLLDFGSRDSIEKSLFFPLIDPQHQGRKKTTKNPRMKTERGGDGERHSRSVIDRAGSDKERSRGTFSFPTNNNFPPNFPEEYSLCCPTPHRLLSWISHGGAEYTWRLQNEVNEGTTSEAHAHTYDFSLQKEK